MSIFYFLVRIDLDFLNVMICNGLRTLWQFYTISLIKMAKCQLAFMSSNEPSSRASAQRTSLFFLKMSMTSVWSTIVA